MNTLGGHVPLYALKKAFNKICEVRFVSRVTQ